MHTYTVTSGVWTQMQHTVHFDKLSSLIEFSVQHRSRQNNRQDKAPTQRLTDREPSCRDQNRSRGQKAEVVSRETTSRIVQDRPSR
ncbi:hypothetical protein LDENG_00285730 [Lucifuga dentata]|nr:hypothetical protein LDENG_00285730 [Lucifuga dentata]